MFFYIFFLLANVFLSASNYHNSVLVPAYDTIAKWNVSPEVAPFVKGPYDVNLFIENSDIVEKKRLTYYSMGLPIAPIPSEKSGKTYPHVTQIFNLIRSGNPGVYPSDYLVSDASAAGLKNPEVSKLISFGQGEDAFRTILLWRELYNQGLLELDIDGICFGSLRIINALFALDRPEEYPGAEAFFTAVGMGRIDREKILSMLRTISLNASLKEPSDSVANGLDFLLKYGTPVLVAGSLLVNPAVSNFLFKGLVFKGVQILRSEKRELGRTVFNASSSVFLPSYNSTYPSIAKMLNRMKHCEKDFPELAFMYMIKKNDIVVGGFDNDTFFKDFPVQDSRKYLIPSPDSNHVTIDPQQRAAKNAFFKQYGSSYYAVPSILEVGRKLLTYAQDNQYKDIDQYIAEMEHRDNYNVLFNGDGLNDANVLVGESDFGIKKARL